MLNDELKTVLFRLQESVEGKTEYADGSIWGLVYLPNLGGNHTLAGQLSALKREGHYRPFSDCFGEVLIRGL